MESTVFLATFAFISFIKVISGQHNALVFKENCGTRHPESTLQPVLTYPVAQNVQDLLNQNENIAELLNFNQHQMLTKRNTLPSPCAQQIQLPPDLQQQPLQVQQYLQLQKPIQVQQTPPLQQDSQPQPQHIRPLTTQSQFPLEILLDAQPFVPLRPQDIQQLQPPCQKQSQLHTDPQLHPYQTLQPIQTSQPLMLQQAIQSLDSLQMPQPNQLQKPASLQQCSLQTPLTSPESKNWVDTPITQKINNNPPSPLIQIKWQSASPVTPKNVETPYYTQKLNIQPVGSSINNPIEVNAKAHNPNVKPQENPSLRYYVLSQPLAPPVVSAASPPLISNHHSVETKTNLKSQEESHGHFTAPFNYVTPSPPNPNTNSQLQYYNRATDSKQNTYINQNSGVRLPEQPPRPIVLQSQTALMASQPLILPSIPISMSQSPSISSQYVFPSGYPVGSFVVPTYTPQKSVSTSLKSILPLIFQLLKEKIAKCGCNNDCPCECKNDRSENELEVATGYSNEKNYGHFNRDPLPVLETVSEEELGPECLREPKNCEEIKNSSPETSTEILEEDICDEEEDIDDDEDS